MARKKKRWTNEERISAIAREARRRGMNYGRFVAIATRDELNEAMEKPAT